MIRILIVDDERLARAELRRLLAAHPHVRVVGEAASAADAAAQIALLAPDLLLLDVQMPGGSGFDLFASLEPGCALPEVIFTTAYDQYALQAFDANALDYLLKPIQPPRLAAALERASARLGVAVPPAALPRKLFIRDGERCWFVSLDDITLLESEGNYTRVHFDGGQPLLARSLLQLEQRLDPRQFFRASRRHIVNLARVRHVLQDTDGTLVLHLDGMAIEVARRRIATFRNIGAL